MAVYVFLADGFEEIEAVSPVDILRRAGVDVKLVSIKKGLGVEGAHKVLINCDCMLEDVVKGSLPDAIVFPGGMPGAVNLAECNKLKEFTLKCFENNRLTCAICASPAIVFGRYGILENKNWTCYPSMESEAGDKFKKGWKEEPVVVDGNLITSRGPGTASSFGYTILEKLGKREAALNIKTGMLF